MRERTCPPAALMMPFLPVQGIGVPIGPPAQAGTPGVPPVNDVLVTDTGDYIVTSSGDRLKVT